MTARGDIMAVTCNQIGGLEEIVMTRRRYQQPKPVRDRHDRWTVRFREDVIDLNGRRKRIHRTRVIGSYPEISERAAKKAAAKLVQPLNSDDYSPQRLGNFAKFAEEWMEQVMIHHKPSTQKAERAVIRTHLVPAFGRLPLTAFTPQMLQAYFSRTPWMLAKIPEDARKALQAASVKTLHNIRMILQPMWKVAQAWGYVQHDPFRGLVMPQREQPKTYAFTLEESAAIIHEAKEPWKTFFHIAAETGMRSGELAGLRVQDFDPVKRTLAVRQSVWRRNVQTPKSKSAYRREPVSVELAEAIEAHIDRMAPNPLNLLFASETGRPLEMIHFHPRVMQPILRKLGIWQRVTRQMGIKQCGLHCFRRMSATQMDEQGVPLATRQDRMGHASPNVTLTNYTKPIAAASREFANRMGSLLAPRTDQVVQ